MNRSTIVAAVLTSSLIAIAAIAQTNMPGFPLNSETAHSAAYMEFDRLVGVMSQVVDPVRDAYYVASQGCNASTIEGMDLSAHMVLNMLEGPGSSLFDVTLDIPLVSGNGIIPIVNAFTLTEGWYDPEETAVQQKDTLEGTLERFQKSFDTLSQYVQSTLEQGITSSEKRSRMIVVCSSLDAKRLQIEGYLATFGYEIRLSPLDSAQQAIDGARDGATVYLWPRTYTESLEISKNITLVGASVGSPLFQTARVVYETTIAPETPDDDGIR
ncbi:hypothetical protein IH601_03915, partial [Candidatus Bipolaricaulota bacterium]|nr:hypothetical protein [Candidatus Bipolaricaulota bacterium]